MIVGGSVNVTSGPRFQIPVERMISAVNVHTTIVSMNGSMPATRPSRTGSSVLAAACAMGDEPWPASFEKTARFMPNRNAEPAVPPMKAPAASVSENADVAISANSVGICS